eukprot:2011684-Ditylum_brightwellii.AAC.1
MIKEQYVRKNKAANVEPVDWKSIGVDWTKVECCDTLYISKCIDCLEWWLNVDSNSTSSCKWFPRAYLQHLYGIQSSSPSEYEAVL